jgi:hypothetical protein
MLSDNIRALIAESFSDTSFSSYNFSSSDTYASGNILTIDNIDEDGYITFTDFYGDSVSESIYIYEMFNYISEDVINELGPGVEHIGVAVANSGFKAFNSKATAIELAARTATSAQSTALGGAIRLGLGPIAIVAAAAAGTSKIMDYFRSKGVSDQEARIIGDITKSASEKMAAMRPESSGFINFLTNMKSVGTGTASAANSLVDMSKAAGSAMVSTYNNISDAASGAYNDLASGASQLADASKDYVIATANGIKSSVAQLEKQREYHNKILSMVERSPSDFKSIVISFFHKYGQNPFIQKLIDISQQNPAVFFALLVAIPVVAIGAALGGTYLVARSIKSQKDAAKAIKSRENELARTSDGKRKKQIENEIGIIAAKGLVVSK